MDCDISIANPPLIPEPQVVQNDDACRGAVKDKANGGQVCRVEGGICFHEGRQGELKTLENGFRRSRPGDILARAISAAA